MSLKAFEDHKYEVIKAHILEPENSPLSLKQQEIMDRDISLAKILYKNPIQKQSIANPQALKVIAMEHANLIKALGDRPDELEDPRRTEKHSFYILVQNNNSTVKLDMNSLDKLPKSTLQELNKALFTGNEILESQVAELFNT